MNKSREEKKIEAIKRLNKMGIWKKAISRFEREDVVFVSEPPNGALYRLNDEEEERVQKFETEHNVLVYMVIRSFTNMGEMDSLLFVSDYPEEWAEDIGDLNNNMAMAYVVNCDYPRCSDMGTIGWKLTPAGGLIRTFE